MDVATYMVNAGLRAGPRGLASNRKLADYIAGDSVRERQRYVLSLIYPYMFFLTIPFGIVGAAVGLAADAFVDDSTWLDAVGLAITFVPASVMLAVYLRCWVDRIGGRDPAALVLTSEGRAVLPHLSFGGYLMAAVLGVVGAFTWAQV